MYIHESIQIPRPIQSSVTGLVRNKNETIIHFRKKLILFDDAHSYINDVQYFIRNSHLLFSHKISNELAIDQ